MKYYADYWNERVYAVAPNGETECKYINDSTGKLVVVNYKRENDEPWMWSENGVGDLVQPMTKTEFDSFGKTWVWNQSPKFPGTHKFTWRDVIQRL